MDKIKDKILTIGVVLLFLFWVFGDTASDYTWADNVSKKYASDGWISYYSMDNFVDPIRFWTLIRTPVSRIWFYNPDATLRHENTSFVETEALLVINQNFERTDTENFQYIFDCENRRYLVLEELSTFEPETAEWNEIKSESSHSVLINKVCQ